MRYFKLAARVRAACHDAVGKGALPNGTDCGAEAGSNLARARAALEKTVVKKCLDATVASLRFDADCAGVAAGDDLADCVQSDHDRRVDGLLRTLYATSSELHGDARKCQATASKGARQLAFDTLKALRRCKRKAAQDKLPIVTRCREEPETVAKLDKKRARARSRIADRCDASVLASVSFGPPCDVATTGPEFAECIVTAADAGSSAASQAVFGNGSFCGDSHQAVEGTIDHLLAQMSLEDKIAQMAGSGLVDGTWRTPANPGLGLPGLSMTDGPRGVSSLVGAGSATAFPVGIARGATWDPDLEARVGEAIGIEARAVGASVLLAPVTTVIRHPRWGRSQETYGEDPLHIGRMGVGFVRGAQRHVIASAKHYALNSIEDTRFSVSVNIDERSLREIYLPHFARLVSEGDVASIMTAYNRVNGLYCAENPMLLTDILKNEWGFRGFVESDWVLGTRSTIPSALAGLDIEMPAPNYFGQPLVDAVNGGDVPVATIDAAVRRIIRTQLCFRLDSDPPIPDPALLETPEHVALALEVAQKSLVLLRNDGGLLPLDRGTLTSIAVTGPLADLENLGDTGSSSVTPSSAVTALEGIQDRAGTVAVEHVVDASTPAGQTAIVDADAVVVVVGFTADDEGEGLIGAGDRETYALRPDQEQLIRDVASLGTPTVVVLEGGSAIGVEAWIDDVDALLMAWYPGMEGGNAIGDVLFGDVNPSGRLPLAVAKLESDLPPFVNDANDVTYGYYHGYRLLDRDEATPRFPFGFGLSYTTFGYSGLQILDPTIDQDGAVRVRFDVTNTGAVAGTEVAQVYVGYLGSSVDRPVRDLKGFARVDLDPGETRTVAIEIAAEDLAYYDTVSGSWVVEPITHSVEVGRSSRDLPLSGAFTVATP